VVFHTARRTGLQEETLHELKKIKPTSSHILWDGAVEIHCFGRVTGNWSLAGATQEEAEKNNPGILGRMEYLMLEYDCDIFAPNPSEFNAKVVHQSDFTDRWLTPGLQTKLYRGLKADGFVLIESGTAFAVSSADCPTAVLYDPKTGRVGAAHAGRDSLIDPGVVHDGKPSREHLSVIDALAEQVGRGDKCQLQAFISCGIGPVSYTHPPDHEIHGEKNRRLIEFIFRHWGGWAVPIPEKGQIWLDNIIFQQLMKHGLSESNVSGDGVCTYASMQPNSREPLWHSHRRGDKTRNLVLVIRR